MARQAYRASLFHLLGDPGADPLTGWHEDGVLVVEDGRVLAAGDWPTIAPTLGDDVPVTAYPNALIVPGFIDCHVHFPQIDIVASPADHLMHWLDTHTYPSELRFADPAVAREAAAFFLDELLRHGTTSALVFATVHRVSAEALFEAAAARNMRIVSGKVLMDRNAPAGLLDTAETGIADSEALIRGWHGKGRLSYALTPRFAGSSTERQLELTHRSLMTHPDVLLHTHLSENHEEIAFIRETFPDCSDYLAAYEKFGLVTNRSVFAHAIHLSDSEWHRLAKADAAIAFCPTSNLFLGSGLFDLARAKQAGVRVGLATDIGAGTSFSLLVTMNEAFKVGQLRRAPPDAFGLFYLATLGAARALHIDGHVGNFDTGKEADFLVLDLAATPLLARRTALAKTPEEMLFALAMLGDDRAVSHTFVAGRRAHSRDKKT